MSTAAPPVDLRPDHLGIVRDILGRHVPDRKVLAFGSRATWTAKEYSDLDLAILGDEPLPLGVTAAMADDFSESDLPFKVDLVDWARLEESFRDIVRCNPVTVQEPLRRSEALRKLDTRPTVNLGELVSNYDSRRVPLSRREREKRQGIYPYYGATGVMDYVDEFLFEGLHLLVAEDGSVEKTDGTPFLQLVDEKFWVNNHAHVLKGESNEETKYLYYALSTIKIRPFISGSVQAKLSQANMNRIPIPYPKESAERSAIASILGALDDKIELNRRMNETLEAMSRAIFKDWFVDFGPTRAKMGGQDLNLPVEITDLFPDTFEDSDLGQIPKDWKVRPLTDIISVNPKRTLKKGTLAPFLEMSNMPTRGPSPDTWRLREMTSGTKFINGDTLMARITPCLEKGKIAFVDFLRDGQVGWGSTEYIVLRPDGEIPPVFAYLLARTPSFHTFAIRQMTGSSGRQRVPPQSLSEYKLALPELDSPVYRALEDMTQPVLARIKLAMMQNRRLAELRDTLLPKLLGGKIELTRIKVIAEEIVR